MDSVCINCKWYIHEEARITIDPYYSSPEEEYCDNNSENFLTEDGCYMYEEK